jgi:hypothetical protein
MTTKRRSQRPPSRRSDDGIDQSLLGELNATKISARELIEYSEECIRLIPADADWRDSFVGSASIAVRLSNKDATKARALCARLTALANITKEGAPGWIREDRAPDGMAIINETLFAAAAVEPLVRDTEGEFRFDRESFLRRALELAERESAIQ